jgi:hypothetical protein
MSVYNVKKLPTQTDQQPRNDRDEVQHNGKDLDDTDDQQPSRLGAVYTRSQLETLPAVHAMIAGIMSQPAAVVLVGGYGLGKTVLVHSWACAVATGKPWLGRTVEKRRVLVVVGEGAYGLDDRICAWETAWNGGQPIADDALTFLVKPGTLSELTTWTQLTEYALDGGYGLVMLDTFSSLAPDADETKDAARIMRRLSDLSAAVNGTAVLVHHPGWSDAGRTRGGYQFEANADEVLVLTGAGGDGSSIVSLTRKKVKDGPEGGTVWLRLATSGRSVIFQQATSDAAEVPLRARILSALDAYGDHGGTGPQLQAELGVADTGRSGFYKALNGLVAEGLIVRVGPRSQQRCYLSAHAPGGAP